MLSIGSVQGGPEVASAAIGRLVDRLMKVATEERGDFRFGSAAALNVVFHIPGSIAPKVGYEGLRDGTFSKTQQLLMVQVAVPKEIVDAQDEALVERFLFDSLREANRIAAKYFKKKGVDYSQPKFLALVDAVEAKFRSP